MALCPSQVVAGTTNAAFVALALWVLLAYLDQSNDRRRFHLDVLSVAKDWPHGQHASDSSQFPAAWAPSPEPALLAPTPIEAPVQAPIEPTDPAPAAPSPPPPAEDEATLIPSEEEKALVDEVPPPNTTQTFSFPRPKGELSANARQLTVHNKVHLTLDDPAAGVQGSLAICILLPNFDEKAHRLLQSIALFEANAFVFIKCTQAVAYLLPKIFPELRFVLYPEITVVPDDIKEAGLAKPPLVRSALEAGVKGAWYMDPGVVLLAPLPTMAPDVDGGIGAAEFFHLQTGYPSMLYVARPHGLNFWEFILKQPNGAYGQAVSEQAVKKTLAARNILWEVFDCPVAAELRVESGGKVQSEAEWQGDSFKLDGCAVTSLRLQDQGPWTINFLWEALNKGKHSANVLFDQVPGSSARELRGRNLRRRLRRLKNRGAKAPEPLPEMWKAQTQVPWWYNIEQMPVADRALVYNHKLIPILDPEAHVVGKVVLCAIFNDLSEEVRRFFQQHRRFHADMTVFVSTTQESVDQVIDLYPDIRLAFVARLDRYRDKDTGVWLGRNQMTKHGLWFLFNAERPDLMKFALEIGASATWYMDADIILVAPLPTFNSSVEVGLAPHDIKPGTEVGAGHFNSGMAYFTTVSQVQHWLEAKKSLKAVIAQTVLNWFRGKPGVLEFNCSLDQAWYQMEADMNKEHKTLADQIKCIDGQVTFKGCRSLTFHFHVKKKGSWIMPHFTRALEQCGNPALPIWHKESYKMKEFQKPLEYWGRSFDTVEPVSNVVDNIVFCLIADKIGGKLHRVLAALHKFQAGSPVFIVGSKDVDEITDLYPNMRLRVFPHLKPSAEDGFRKFVTEKAFLLRAALSAGGRGAWFLAASKVADVESGKLFSEDRKESGESYFTSINDVYHWNDTAKPKDDEGGKAWSELSAVFHGD
mmetsp:Transcript_70422/g.153552  ORF Transcript_70422/g.153552 Transcript_70422/m.153552 type:complete len:924 (-) Transcript_70422:48-2819(-)|eukprot:CAMPEP_0206540870 /NCGR_PEP_ID=MMETSP0325_2-20121206/9270_1 /ASSEMBLY_ACC=CAM_ASM_000347 /TAXON_ID=2866 /ORGANISM="Crypthecodinium cohnii, Strain Seligo" /LENGTH=923 /DNA_ID=CAMNT_0054038691 /DNA_START=60 /DNA_END=2831 /DNA_ORIENTATION=-